jgi:hypothetical protein
MEWGRKAIESGVAAGRGASETYAMVAGFYRVVKKIIINCSDYSNEGGGFEWTRGSRMG